MHPSPMIELMQYPFAVPLVTLLYTAVHILPVNLTRLYIFRHYLRFSPQWIVAGLLLFIGIEAIIQIEAVTVFSRRIRSLMCRSCLQGFARSPASPSSCRFFSTMGA